MDNNVVLEITRTRCDKRFWDKWNADKEAMQEAGYQIRKLDDGQWYYRKVDLEAERNRLLGIMHQPKYRPICECDEHDVVFHMRTYSNGTEHLFQVCRLCGVVARQATPQLTEVEYQ